MLRARREGSDAAVQMVLTGLDDREGGNQRPSTRFTALRTAHKRSILRHMYYILYTRVFTSRVHPPNRFQTPVDSETEDGRDFPRSSAPNKTSPGRSQRKSLKATDKNFFFYK